MATVTRSRDTRAQAGESTSKRSAAVEGEPRDANGRWQGKTSGSRSKNGARRLPGGEYSTGAMIGVAAAGLAVGLAANVARKFAVQAPTALASDWDEALAVEHRMTLKIFDALEGTTDSNAMKRATLLAQLKHALAKHAMEEENVIYPALREVGEIDAADELNKEHGYVKQYLYELTEMAKDSAKFLPTLRRFRADIEKHMRDEEDRLFPSLKLRITPEKNKELTSAMNKEGLKLA